MKIYNQILSSAAINQKKLAVLIDPDKINNIKQLDELLQKCIFCCVDYVFVGGSLMTKDTSTKVVDYIKKKTIIPVIIFPGSPLQIVDSADAILFLSLISGRNAELLIGSHVIAAPYLKKTGIEVISTGYILIDCGNPTTVSYISQTQPIPYNKPEIAVCTALAGEMLGLKLIYLDGGSGALKPISTDTIKQVKQNITVPLIVGGGIRSLEEANIAWENGADIIVIGTAFEENSDLLLDFANRKAKA